MVPLTSTGRQLASSRITWVASRTSLSVVGLPLSTRTAESPRPMPHTVRLPYISLRVAKTDAVTVQSRVAGLVTIGPTMTRWVAAEDRRVDDVRLLPEQVGVEGPDVVEAVLLGLLGQADGAPGGRVGLQDDTEVHVSSLVGVACAQTEVLGQAALEVAGRGRRDRGTRRRRRAPTPRESTTSTWPSIS